MKAVSIAFCLYVMSSALHAAFPSPADYDVYRGSISFRNFGDHMIGILLVDEHGQAGGYVHLFRLWTETPVNPIRVDAPSASVEFRGRELVILVPEKQLFYTFVLSDAQFGAPTAPAGFTSTRYVGYGLNHEIRPVVSKSRPAGGRGVTATFDGICDSPGVDCYIENPDPNGGGSGGGSTCDAGGSGANSCSVSNPTYGGCSIGCGTGYYACCVQASMFYAAHCYCVRQ